MHAACSDGDCGVVIWTGAPCVAKLLVWRKDGWIGGMWEMCPLPRNSAMVCWRPFLVTASPRNVANLPSSSGSKSREGATVSGFCAVIT